MIVAMIQARMGSTRLPNKVMMDLSGKPAIVQLINRLKYSKRIDKIIVVTTNHKADDVIEKICKEINLEYFRGSEEDVLDRYYKAYKENKLNENDTIIRITGDCPLIDPELLDKVVDFYNEGKYDYVSNAIEPTFPDGLDTEVFRGKALEEAWLNASLKSEREHVTVYIRNHIETYKIGSYKGSKDLSNLRWTLDEIEDYEFIKEIYDALYKENEIFLMNQIEEYIKLNPQIVEKNIKFARNEGYQKSISKDEILDRRGLDD